MRQNQRIIRLNACNLPAAWDVCRQPVQVEASAGSREPISPASDQYRPRRAPHRLRLRGSDRALLVWMTWLWPSPLGLSRVVPPDHVRIRSWLLPRRMEFSEATAAQRRACPGRSFCAASRARERSRIACLVVEREGPTALRRGECYLHSGRRGDIHLCCRHRRKANRRLC